MLCITLSAAYAVARFLSITSVYSVETNKHLQFFSPSDSHTSFSIPNIMALFRHGDPNGRGVECKAKIAILSLSWLHRVL